MVEFERPESKPTLTKEFADELKPYFSTLPDELSISQLGLLVSAPAMQIRESFYDIKALKENEEFLKEYEDFIKNALMGQGSRRRSVLSRAVFCLTRYESPNLKTVGDLRSTDKVQLIKIKEQLVKIGGIGSISASFLLYILEKDSES